MVRVKLNDYMAVALDLLDVAALWVGWVGDCAIPGAGAGGQDVHVVSVEVDRVT